MRNEVGNDNGSADVLLGQLGAVVRVDTQQSSNWQGSEDYISKLLGHAEGGTDLAKRAVVDALAICVSLKHAIFDVPHFLHALAESQEGREGFARLAIDAEKVRLNCWNTLKESTRRGQSVTTPQPSPEIGEINKEAQLIAGRREAGNRKVQLADFLEAISKDPLRQKFAAYLPSNEDIPTVERSRKSVAAIEVLVERELSGSLEKINTLVKQFHVVNAIGTSIGVFEVSPPNTPPPLIKDRLRLIVGTLAEVEGGIKKLSEQVISVDKHTKNVRSIAVAAAVGAALAAIASSVAVVYLLYSKL